eukprot:TRINITY_DN16228_c0_g2_i1.p2 TRINITY_DN16228_c0_g2~~TRINITY_DN16228_c0_g2_i1.p2  ORF type:complete len:150 (+),score=33.58 TRINITY_DN16228_c0_g2_i1:14-463(+)
MSGADCSDPAIIEAYNDVRNDANDVDYVVLNYEDPKSNKIVVGATGAGDVEAMAANFKDDEVQYGYVRVTLGDEQSKRAKFVFVAWVGENVGGLRKGRVSVHKADIKAIFKDFGVEISANDADDLSKEAVTKAVVKAGGANYSGDLNLK